MSDWSYFDVLTLMGGIALAGMGVDYLVRLVRPLNRLRIAAFNRIAVASRVNKFEKSAQAAAIESAINSAAYELKPFMPDNWMRRAKLKWVSSPDATLVREGEVLLRVQPRLDPNESLMQALWQYFATSAFPESMRQVPSRIRLALALVLARTGLQRTSPFLVDEFDQKFVLATAAEGKIDRETYADLLRLNEIGLLAGPMIRELDRAASKLTVEGRAGELAQVTTQIINHLLNFQPAVRFGLSDEDWICRSAYGQYALLLVSRPPHSRPDISAYVDRVKSKTESGVERIYVIGRSKESQFFSAVVKDILRVREIKGLGEFKLLADYRSDPNGLCVLVGIDEVLSKLQPDLKDQIDSNLSIEAISKEEIGGQISKTDPIDAKIDLLEQLVLNVLDTLTDYDGEWINLANFGSKLRVVKPDFDPRTYGERNLVSILERMKSLEFFERQDPQGTVVFVRQLEAGNLEAKGHSLTKEKECIEELVKEASNGNWVVGTQLGALIRRDYPDFSAARHGVKLLSDFIGTIDGVEIEKVQGSPTWYARSIPNPLDPAPNSP